MSSGLAEGCPSKINYFSGFSQTYARSLQLETNESEAYSENQNGKFSLRVTDVEERDLRLFFFFFFRSEISWNSGLHANIGLKNTQAKVTVQYSQGTILFIDVLRFIVLTDFSCY